MGMMESAGHAPPEPNEDRSAGVTIGLKMPSDKTTANVRKAIINDSLCVILE